MCLAYTRSKDLEGILMANYICPICEVEPAQEHDCSDYNLSSFAFELELLGIQFLLEPDDSRDGQSSAHFLPDRSSAGNGIRSKMAPLFLRL